MTAESWNTDIPDHFRGWDLSILDSVRIIWKSPSDFAVKIELPKSNVTGILPPVSIESDSGQPSLQVITSIHPGTGDQEEAIQIATNFLELNPIAVNSAVRDLPGIGDRVADYLALNHKVKTVSDVKFEYRHGELKQIVQKQYHEELENELFKSHG